MTGGLKVRNPIPPKIRRVWGLLHAKPYIVAKRPPVGVARKFGEGVTTQVKAYQDMDNQRLGSIKNNSSMSIETSLLSLEIIQDYTTDEKPMNIAERISSSPDGRLGQTKENVRTLEPKSLKSDRECKAIRVSVIISPIKHIRNIVKDRTIEAEEPSCSSEAQRNKDFESSSVKII
ncbi:hypothetical protein AVEN_188871-1 [Araneus ventricosus]|uniref:Uncharacterized protein n=1 Tax=Araneus ventricosus TaxID=182803 RepID=A0A4Y2A6E4_ARAVE|nr:hypothetical protein AVEN_188871-1 [Araneus ventricosus]